VTSSRTCHLVRRDGITRRSILISFTLLERLMIVLSKIPSTVGILQKISLHGGFNEPGSARP